MRSQGGVAAALVTVGFIAALGAPARAGDARVKLEAGGLATRASETVDIAVDKNTLDWAAAAIGKQGGNEAELRRLMTELDGIYVQSLEFKEASRPAWSEMLEVSKGVLARLDGPGWTTVVSSTEQGRDGGEIERVSLYTDAAGKPGGLVVFAVEPGEMSLVNVVGPIKLEQLSRLGASLGDSSMFEALQGAAKAGQPKPAAPRKPAKAKP